MILTECVDRMNDTHCVCKPYEWHSLRVDHMNDTHCVWTVGMTLTVCVDRMNDTHCVCGPFFLYPSPTSGLLGCLHILAAMNNDK